MILRLFGFIVLYGCCAIAALWVAYRAGSKLLRGRLMQWSHRRLGRHNARLLSARREELCSFCQTPTSPELDAYRDRIGWYHQACYDKLLSE